MTEISPAMFEAGERAAREFGHALTEWMLREIYVAMQAEALFAIVEGDEGE